LKEGRLPASLGRQGKNDSHKKMKTFHLTASSSADYVVSVVAIFEVTIRGSVNGNWNGKMV